MRQMLAELFGSKKFIVMIAAIVVYVASRFGLDAPPDATDKLLELVGAWLIAKGIQDHGVAMAAKDAPKPP